MLHFRVLYEVGESAKRVAVPVRYTVEARDDEILVLDGNNEQKLPLSELLAEAMTSSDGATAEIVSAAISILAGNTVEFQADSTAALWFALGRASVKGETLRRCRSGSCGRAFLSADSRVKFCSRHRVTDRLLQRTARTYARTRLNHEKTGCALSYSEWSEGNLAKFERAERAHRTHQDEQYR